MKHKSVCYIIRQRSSEKYTYYYLKRPKRIEKNDKISFDCLISYRISGDLVLVNIQLYML